MLSNNAQALLEGWIAAASPVVEKVYGTSEASWPEVRARYMQGLENLFPAFEGVSYQTVMSGNTPAMLSEPGAGAGDAVVLYLHAAATFMVGSRPTAA